MNKTEYIEIVQGMLTDDMHSHSKIVPNGLAVIKAMGFSCNPRVSQEVIDKVESMAKWIEDYFENCKHYNRPIDMTLAHNLINSISFVEG